MDRAAASWALRLALLALAGGCEAPSTPPSAEALQEFALRQGTPAVSATLSTSTPNGAEVARQPHAPGVRLTVVGARDLENYDGPGDTDPYVQIDWDGRRWRTSVVDGELSPTWGDSFLLPVRELGSLTATVWDSDAVSDEKMAVVAVELPALQVGETATLEVPLRGGDGGVLVLRFEGVALPR